MTCAEAEPLLDRFLDRDLDPAELLEVARHTGSCAGCDGRLQSMAGIGRVLSTLIATEAAEIDLGSVWPAVDARIDRFEAQRRRGGRLRAIPLAAAGFAIAASIALWLRPATDLVIPTGGPGGGPPRMARVAARMPNDARFDRFRGNGATISREPKEGTTLIWVNYNPENPR